MLWLITKIVNKIFTCIQEFESKFVVTRRRVACVQHFLSFGMTKNHRDHSLTANDPRKPTMMEQMSHNESQIMNE